MDRIRKLQADQINVLFGTIDFGVLATCVLGVFMSRHAPNDHVFMLIRHPSWNFHLPTLVGQRYTKLYMCLPMVSKWKSLHTDRDGKALEEKVRLQGEQ